MSLLDSANPSSSRDKASRSGMLLSILAATAVLLAALLLLWWHAHQPPPLVGRVTQLWIHPMHTVLQRKDANGVEQLPEAFDQVLVLAQIHLQNQSKQPVILKQLLTNLTFPDGMDSSYAATPTDYDRVFLAYPELASLRTQPLHPDTILQPGASTDGMILSSFQLSADRWKQQRGMHFEIDLKMHPALILTPAVAPILR